MSLPLHPGDVAVARSVNIARTNGQSSNPAASVCTGCPAFAGHHDRSRGYAFSGVGLSAGGSMPNVFAVMQVIEKLPVAATSATMPSVPIAFSAAA